MVGTLGRQSGVVTRAGTGDLRDASRPLNAHYAAVRAYGSSLSLLGSGWRL